MEQDAQITADFMKMTGDLIRENSVAFAVGGLIFFGVIASISIKYADTIQKSINTQSVTIAQLFRTSSTDTDNMNSVAESIRDQSIDYISPNPHRTTSESESLGLTATENGQISAISSGQVTYRKNRYIILRGESLQDVARKVYGDPKAWVRIAEANDIKNPDHIEVGMELIIPR